ncbi:MAG: sugar ABC transporter ATP-binding protein, partial [Candidatus Eremiobacteraeota bacterium]|nr:sugar ABC transporter ATP-binding protein [Candidatus Eremiobacteraeota bacterium]
MTPASIRFENATVRYAGAGRNAFENVKFECQGGELVVLLG